ncbi:hypothetical protein VU04_05815, partial [Desulfobulbus sp. TB]|nr:hypothetical protein [Desulfobulbus sp. TB]
LVVLFAIFFGAVALFERKAATSMFQNLMASLPSWVPQCGIGCCMILIIHIIIAPKELHNVVSGLPATR